MRKYYLAPVDNRKSFYGKAYVIVSDNGTETLYSYDTEICKRSIDGTITRIWPGWSATTGRHIKAFCGMNKKEFCKLPVTFRPEHHAAAYEGTLFF